MLTRKFIFVGAILFIYVISLCSGVGVVPNSQSVDLWTNLIHKISELINELSGKAPNSSNSTASTLAVMGILLILPVGLVLRGKSSEEEEIPPEFWEDEKWAEEHYPELQKKFKNQWVAVVNKEAVAHGKNLAKVEEEARLKTGKKHISVTFVESGNHVYKG